jgi:hypothetical protein
MKTTIFTLLLLSFIIFFQLSDAQTVTALEPDFVINFDNAKKRTPATLKIKKGQTRDYKFFVFQGKAYLLTFKVPTGVKYWGFRILDENGNVLFDNALVGNTNSAVIFADETKKVTVRLTVQPPRLIKNSKKVYEFKLKIAYKKSISV